MLSRSAVISECGKYRYALWREWDHLLLLPTCCFVMLNPSTADAEKDDPTIRRCVGFAKKWGFGRVVVLNLFAYRTYDPSLLRQDVNPVDTIGPENDKYLRSHTASAGLIVAAWGSFPVAKARAEEVKRLINCPMYCLGLTKDGSPRHPLYVPANAERVPFCGMTLT